LHGLSGSARQRDHISRFLAIERRSNLPCNGFGSASKRIIVEVSIPGGGRGLSMAKQLPDNRQAQACHSRKLHPADSRDEAESARHPVRCLRSSSCLGRLSPTSSVRAAGLRSRISRAGRRRCWAAIVSIGHKEPGVYAEKLRELNEAGADR